MRTARIYQAVLLVSLSVATWMSMMLVHEAGHVFAAVASGGQVTRVVWHPLAFSRTDVSPNPHPLFVVWAGPILGALWPYISSIALARFKRGVIHLLRFWAGFCLIANGAYLGIGWIDEVGDAGDLLRLGTPIWMLIGFGLVTVPLGFHQWHLATDGLRHRSPTLRRDAWFCFGFAGVLVFLASVIQFGS